MGPENIPARKRRVCGATFAACLALSGVMGLSADSNAEGSIGAFESIPTGRLRVIIETDAPGGDPDDEASLVRFFLYMNEWDVEGLIGTRGPRQSRLGISGKERILQYVTDYEKVYHNLRVHRGDYPVPDDLRSITKQCYSGTEGRDFVISVIDKDDPRPLWYLNWGTNEEDDKPTALREALDHVQRTRPASAYRDVVGKICYVEVHKRDFLGSHRHALASYVDTFYPTMDGGRWYHRWRPLTEAAGGFDVDRDIKGNHGPLCANYTIQKEGDTPTFMHLIPNGLNVPHRGDWGGWSGRYSFNEELRMWWCDQRDTWRRTTSRDNTLTRWAAHIQNDFKARADWCMAETFAQANHEPVPCLQGDRSLDALLIDVQAGSTVTLSAAQSTDPDGDNLTYQWTFYPEPGSYPGEVVIENAEAERCKVHVPMDARDKTIHLILQVTDDGDPPLTRYRRAILTAVQAPPAAR